MNNPTKQSIRAIVEAENLLEGKKIDTIQRLEGGLINFTYRVILQNNPKSFILKYYPSYIASIPDVYLSSSRCFFERHALQNLPSLIQYSRTPSFINGTQSINIIEDKGILPSLRIAHSPKVIKGIAIWLAHVHENTKTFSQYERDLWNNNDIQRSRKQNQYEYLAKNIDHPQAQKAMYTLGKKLLQPGICTIMGDLWPSSILIDKMEFWVIDWEFSHFGRPLQDVSHICAHFILMEQPSYCRLFLENYLRLVSEELQMDVTSYDATVHFCAEILMRLIGLFKDKKQPILREWALDILKQKISFSDLISKEIFP